MIHPIETNISPITALPGLLAEDRPDAVNNLVEVELPTLSSELENWTGEVNQLAQELQDIGQNAINAITFDNIAQLKLNSNMGRVDVLGYYVKGDNRVRTFYWDSTSTETDNDGTIIQATGIPIGRWKDSNISNIINVRDFGAKGDGITDDTIAIQKAVNFGKFIVVPYGQSGVYKLTDAIYFNNAGKTLKFDNNAIVFKKFYGSSTAGMGNAIVVNSAYTSLINIGIDGNGANYSGSGIAFNTSTTYYTYGCRIVNPRIFDTKDSCIVFVGARGAPDIVIDGGSLTTYQDPSWSGASSSGFPAIRIVGAVDGEPSPRVFTNITNSSGILLDATGMNCFKMSNCFTGTILFKGNPNVIGGASITMQTGEIAINNTYIRDGLNVAGFEVSIDNCLSHGHAPLTWDTYGGKPTSYSSYGWEIDSNSSYIRLGASNVVTQGIKDNSPQGVSSGLLSQYYDYAKAYPVVWGSSGTQPSLGNGSITGVFSVEGLYIDVTISLSIGSTTTLGTGDWNFTLPRFTDTQAGSQSGQWTAYLYGIGRKAGISTLYGTGSSHTICMQLSDGSPAGSGSIPSIPAGSSFSISYRYRRG